MPQPGRRRPDAQQAPVGDSPPQRLGARLREALADALDLPKELVFDLPRITLLGAMQFTVENHRGLLEFSPERVAISTHGGRIVVTGRDLSVGVVRDGEIIVTGRLEAVRFEGPVAKIPIPGDRV